MVSVETVEKYYCDQGLIAPVIAAKIGHTETSEIESIIEDHNMKRGECKAQDPVYVQEQLDNGRMPHVISTLTGVKSTTGQIRDIIREHDLDMSNASLKSNEKSINGVVDEDLMYDIEYFWQDSEQLYRAYWEYYWSIRQIAEWCGINRNRLSRYIRDECDWETRTDTVGNHVRLMKVRGESLERIQALYPYETANRHAGQTEQTDETQEHSITWSDVE